MMKENFVELVERSIKENWVIDALSNFEKEPLKYGEVAAKIAWYHNFFAKSNIKKGDKVALIGKNSVNWAVTYLATISYGAVIVPILPDFNADDVHHIVNHSDSKLLFCSESIYEKLDDSIMRNLDAVFNLEDLKLLFNRKKGIRHILEKSHERSLEVFAESFSLPKIDNEDLAAIVYTSGTTGFSKGVMLQHNSLAANIIYAHINMPLKPGDSILSFMPLAHTYGCAFEFLFPFTLGCHITFLNKTPSPKIIVKAFQKIKPQLILSVPLIIEKIYKKQILPQLKREPVKTLSKIPVLKNVIKNAIKKKLMEAFGNNFHEIVVGGAALNNKVEAFLADIKFPFTIGYGMTECGPLISYASHKIHRLQSVGRVVNTMEVEIDSDDPQNQAGEILVRGENVMKGYYKNESATNSAIDKDGWLHTGDMGLLDEDGFIYIKGRCKNMILGPSGQNIYPEEIEARLNNMPLVQEALVIEHNQNLKALIYPDIDIIDARSIDNEKLKQIMEQNRKKINQQLPVYSRIKHIELYPEEFEKTPTKKIKRFLYTISGKE